MINVATQIARLGLGQRQAAYQAYMGAGLGGPGAWASHSFRRISNLKKLLHIPIILI